MSGPVGGTSRHNQPEPDSKAWAAAMIAGMQAQRDFRANNGNPDWDSDWDDEVEAILEAVWPHIAAAVVAGSGTPGEDQ